MGNVMGTQLGIQESLLPKQLAVGRWLVVLLSLVMCGYLLSPVLYSTHLEGFTAQSESIAYLQAMSPGVQHDPYLPSVSQFIYQTRSGLIDLLSLIYRLLPDAGDRAYQFVVLSSLVLLLLSSAWFAKRLAGVPVGFALVAMILTQGIPESGFFFNDNIVSAALAASTLALVASNTGRVVSLLAGALFGFSLLTRLDAILVTPFLVGAIFCQTRSWRQGLLSLLSGVLAATVVLLISAITHGFSIVDAVYTAQKFTPVIKAPWLWFYVRMLFFGLIGLPLVALGCYLFYTRSALQPRLLAMAAFLAYPVVLIAVAPGATEVRYIFLLLAPWVAMQGGLALQWLVQAWEKPEKRRLVIGAALVFATVMLLPPSGLQVKDGPRYLIGRVWGIAQWRVWQDAVHESLHRVDTVVQALSRQPLSVVVTTHYNDEFYLRLRLIQAGFMPEATDQLFPDCSGFSVLYKGNSLVAHVRTAPQYWQIPISSAYNAALQLSAAGACAGLARPSQVLVTTFSENRMGMDRNIYGLDSSRFKGPLAVMFPDGMARVLPKTIRHYGMFDYTQLSKPEFAEIVATAARYRKAYPESDPASGELLSIGNYRNYYAELRGPTEPYLSRLQHFSIRESSGAR